MLFAEIQHPCHCDRVWSKIGLCTRILHYRKPAKWLIFPFSDWIPHVDGSTTNSWWLKNAKLQCLVVFKYACRLNTHSWHPILVPNFGELLGQLINVRCHSCSGNCSVDCRHEVFWLQPRVETSVLWNGWLLPMIGLYQKWWGLSPNLPGERERERQRESNTHTRTPRIQPCHNEVSCSTFYMQFLRVHALFLNCSRHSTFQSLGIRDCGWSVLEVASDHCWLWWYRLLLGHLAVCHPWGHRSIKWSCWTCKSFHQSEVQVTDSMTPAVMGLV